ncbi:MAG TPA: alpha/beta fold hydrolase, partial [Thermomonas sp.]|uniref:alpha/beta hydrolase n=1 Tax=Thermomonas sp. TaxID=1971895 RepID=UPI002BB04AB8
MRHTFIASVLAASLAIAGTSHAQTADPAALAQQALDALDAGHYAQVEQLFGPQMAAAVPADKLQAIWESLPAQMGNAKGREQAQVSAQGDTHFVQIPLHFEKAELVAKFAIDASGKIVGFLIQPAQSTSPAPAVAADANFSERDFSVGDGERALPGTLAMPKGNGPFPAVVLVHGSGPQDRDETIGPNKPFLDIARTLAAQGIAVLRYDKRTKARPQDFAGGNFGVDDETTNDAVIAVDALRKTDDIDPKRIFVLGHSQGGMLAPRIAAVSGHVAGLILMAAPTRPLLDILIEQNRRLAALNDGKIDDAERAAINAIIEQVRITRDPKTAATSPTVMGQPAGYWRSIEAVDAVSEAQQVRLPMLLLQGARDIQVVDADWQNWRDAFADDPEATFKLYPKLNHLGIAGEGEGS